MGVVRVSWPIFECHNFHFNVFGTGELKHFKVGVYIDIDKYCAYVIDYLPKWICSGLYDPLNFWKITDSILETVQKRRSYNTKII